MLKIAYFIDSLRYGGKERQLVELLKGINDIKYIKQYLLCMDKNDFYKDYVNNLGIDIRYFIRKFRWDPTIFLNLYKYIKKHEIDIIYTNSWMTSFYAVPISKILRKKIINNSIRNAFKSGGIKWTVERILIKMSDIRVANSKAGLLSRGLSPKFSRNHVIHNGFDLRRLGNMKKPKDIKKELNICNEKVVGMVAEFSDYKDYQSFIIAAKMVFNKMKNVIFIAAGDGKNLNYYKKLSLEISSNIRYTGKVEDVESIINIFDIGILSTYTEGISNSIMEYMALEKPVIATDGGGTKEIVLDGVNGFLIPQKRPDILAEKIQFLLCYPGIAIEMGREGRKYIEEKYSFERMIFKTIELFKFAAGKKDR